MSNFVDRARITCKAGDGGNGCVSFHREKFVQNGGPDGGDGGNGGSILLYADPNMHTLLDFRFKTKYTAEDGTAGSALRCKGKSGGDCVIKVPVGTVLRDEDTDRIVADMDESGETRLLLKGGRGGWGNAHFATPTRQAPNFAKPGIKTQVHTFRLELKTIADVGLVGYPNVGKSTILSVVTAARPKIGNYHFTTLTPNLGIVRRHGTDIVLDIAGSEGRDPVADFDQINLELANYGDLANRPQIVVCNKADLLESDENLERMKAHVAPLGWPVFAVSAAAHHGFDALLDCAEKQLETLPPIQHFTEEAVPEDEILTNDFSIEVEDGVYVVTGPAMAHLVASVNFEDDESLNWFHRTLRRLGVIDALREKGAKEGSTVAIDDMEFDFID